MRSFHKNYTQELSKFDPSKSKLRKLTVTLDQASNSVKINATANEKSGKVSLKNADVSVFVKRYFGNLQIGKTTPTDANGNITVVLPKDLPGDKTGAIEVLVKAMQLMAKYKLPKAGCRSTDRQTRTHRQQSHGGHYSKHLTG